MKAHSHNHFLSYYLRKKQFQLFPETKDFSGPSTLRFKGASFKFPVIHSTSTLIDIQSHGLFSIITPYQHTSYWGFQQKEAKVQYSLAPYPVRNLLPHIRTHTSGASNRTWSYNYVCPQNFEKRLTSFFSRHSYTIQRPADYNYTYVFHTQDAHIVKESTNSCSLGVFLTITNTPPIISVTIPLPPPY